MAGKPHGPRRREPSGHDLSTKAGRNAYNLEYYARNLEKMRQQSVERYRRKKGLPLKGPVR